jgi:hypothetical protein
MYKMGKVLETLEIESVSVGYIERPIGYSKDW